MITNNVPAFYSFIYYCSAISNKISRYDFDSRQDNNKLNVKWLDKRKEDIEVDEMEKWWHFMKILQLIFISITWICNIGHLLYWNIVYIVFRFNGNMTLCNILCQLWNGLVCQHVKNLSRWWKLSNIIKKKIKSFNLRAISKKQKSIINIRSNTVFCI